MDDLNFSSKRFWSLVGMKLIRNLASVKYQWLLMLYVPAVWGMFNICPATGKPWVSDVVGFGFLGGGFITLASSRLIANINLNGHGDKEGYHKNSVLNTDE